MIQSRERGIFRNFAETDILDSLPSRARLRGTGGLKWTDCEDDCNTN